MAFDPASLVLAMASSAEPLQQQSKSEGGSPRQQLIWFLGVERCLQFNLKMTFMSENPHRHVATTLGTLITV